MDQSDRHDPDEFCFLGLPFAAPVGGDLLLTLPQEDAVSAALNALGCGAALVLVAGDAGSGRTLVTTALADALRGRGLVVDEIARLGGLGGTALLQRLAPLLRTDPDRLAPGLAAFGPDASGAASFDPAGPDSSAPGRAVPHRRQAALQHAGEGAREPYLSGPNVSWPEVAGLEAGELEAAGLEMLRAAAQAGGRVAAGTRAEPALAVVVDDAGTWPTESLLLLASLACPPARDLALLQVVLIGDAGLERRLAAPSGAGPAGGPAAPVSLRIPPLTPRQGREYLAHRFAAAGASLERTLSAAAVGEILARCGGNPGRIDRLVDDCLALTARRRRRMVTPAVVRAARQPIPRRSGRLSSPVICALLGATGGVLAAGAGLGLAAHDWTPAFLAPSDGGAAGPAGASLPAATPEGPDAALFAGAGRFGTPSSLDSAPAPHGAADRPAGPPGLVAAVPQPAAPPPPAPPARIALAPVPVVPRPVPATLPALPVVPRIAAPEMAAVTARPLPLDPAPVAPALATPDAPPRLAAPLLASAAPVVIRAGGSAGVPDLAPPVLPLPAAWPAQPRIAEAPAASAPRAVADAAQAGAPVSGAAVPPSGEPLASPSSAAVPPAATGSPKAAVPRYDGAVVLHAARARDTASVLLRRIWGQDDAMVEALFRSLNPAIDARGPWPAGTMVTVPQRTRRTRGDAAPLARPRTEQARVELPTPPAPPRPDAIRDNPAGQVQSSVPYFCRSILPQNGAEDAYTRQVCGR